MSMRERVEDTEFSACARNEYGARALGGHGRFSTSKRSGSTDSSGYDGICVDEGKPFSNGFLSACLSGVWTSKAFEDAPFPSSGSPTTVPALDTEIFPLAPEINTFEEF